MAGTEGYFGLWARTLCLCVCLCMQTVPALAWKSCSLHWLHRETHTLSWHAGFELPSNRAVKVIIQATFVGVCEYGAVATYVCAGVCLCLQTFSDREALCVSDC